MIVHDTHKKLESLTNMMRQVAPPSRFNVSNVSRVGSVMVKFRSGPDKAASEYADDFESVIGDQISLLWIRIDVDKFSISFQ